MRLTGVSGDTVELQAAADLYGVDINIYETRIGAERPKMIVESSGEVEYLPISLWCEDELNYHVFVDVPVGEVPSRGMDVPSRDSQKAFESEQAEPGKLPALGMNQRREAGLLIEDEFIDFIDKRE